MSLGERLRARLSSSALLRALFLKLRGTAQEAYLIERFLTEPAWERHAADRAGTCRRIVRCYESIKAASSWWVGLHYAAEILRAPGHDPVIEFGCYQGASTAALSIAAKIAGRKLVVCDSFEGLPEPRADDRYHRSFLKNPDGRNYEAGQYAGSLELVRENVARYGEIDVCEFVVGRYESSLPALARSKPDAKYALAVLDVDLFQSTRECLQYVWPRLPEGARLFTDDGGELDIAAMFFERAWWRETFGEEPPGLFGAGYGVNFFQSAISSVGFAIKGHHLQNGSVR